jgi:serine/threonine-protein kinase
VASEQAFDDQVPAGSVVSQDPGEGSAFRGDTVTLVISQGPELVEVPQLIGMQWEQAESTLSEMGLEVAREDLAGGYFNTVRFQSVEPGESVPKGTEVVLTVL